MVDLFALNLFYFLLYAKLLFSLFMSFTVEVLFVIFPSNGWSQVMDLTLQLFNIIQNTFYYKMNNFIGEYNKSTIILCRN